MSLGKLFFHLLLWKVLFILVKLFIHLATCINIYFSKMYMLYISIMFSPLTPNLQSTQKYNSEIVSVSVKMVSKYMHNMVAHH